MPHSKVEDPRIVADGQIIGRIRSTAHAHSVGAIVVGSGNVRAHMGYVVKHKAIFVINGKRPKGSVVWILKSR